MKDREPNKKQTLIKTGALVSGIGVFTIAEGIINQHGEFGSVGTLISGAGVVLLLTAVRKKS